MTKDEKWIWAVRKKAQRECDFYGGRDCVAPLLYITTRLLTSCYRVYLIEYYDFLMEADDCGQYGGGEIYAHD